MCARARLPLRQSAPRILLEKYKRRGWRGRKHALRCVSFLAGYPPASTRCPVSSLVDFALSGLRQESELQPNDSCGHGGRERVCLLSFHAKGAGLLCFVSFYLKKILFNVIGKRWEKVFGRYMHFTSDSYVKYYTILLYINFSLIF